MQTKETSVSDVNSRHCKPKYYKGTLCEFANDILTKGRGGGTVCRVCDIAPTILNDMKTRGVELLSKDVVVTQRQIFKYRNHPKTRKGANIPIEDYGVIEATLKDPTHIYEDTVQKRLVYVCSYPYQGNRLVKVVVEPNFKNQGVVVNLAKSWGIVQCENMRGGQYRLIR
ncbi:MAG: hypothetical protein J6X98_09305 [Bacteroidales bacterium]|nr:hypothetical protein [Bacteroidales bacterium]